MNDATPHIVFGSDVADLEAIFDPQVQLATAPLSMSADIAAHFEAVRPGWEWRQIVPVDEEHQPDLRKLRSLNASDAPGGEALRSAAAEVLELMAVLFGSEALGVRVTDARQPPCPRFHVDRVLARGVLTLVGRGSEYLLDHEVDRSKLGHGAGGLSDETSGLVAVDAQPRPLESGQVCLFKGENWPSNAGKGLVHRSAPEDGSPRWLLTVDLPRPFRNKSCSTDAAGNRPWELGASEVSARNLPSVDEVLSKLESLANFRAWMVQAFVCRVGRGCSTTRWEALVSTRSVRPAEATGAR